MKDFVPSSPHFFRPVKTAFALGLLALLLLAWLFPAPLQEAADLTRVPNPARSAWFLLWMQELVSYSAALVYLIAALAALFALLPWLPGTQPAQSARWLPGDQRGINRLTILTFLAIIVLTLVASFCRGENWSFVLPF